MDEEVRLGVRSADSADGDAAETPAGQRKPPAAGVVSGHHHGSDARVTLTAHHNRVNTTFILIFTSLLKE